MNLEKSKLSRGVLEMKFMKRTKEKVEKEQFQEEGEEYFENALTKRMKNESERFIIEPSYMICENLIDGRLSFQGMNPEIEKLMEAEKELDSKVDVKEDTDVSDEQMVKTWKNNRKGIKSKHERVKSFNKYNTGDEPLAKKPKFLKPET